MASRNRTKRFLELREECKLNAPRRYARDFKQPYLRLLDCVVLYQSHQVF